jgi:hypothetical protein
MARDCPCDSASSGSQTGEGGVRRRLAAVPGLARSPGFDFPIKVAYAQGQLRQLIFGGITRHILANATLPSSRRIDP